MGLIKAGLDAPGVTTSLTVTPDQGYMLDTLTVEYDGTQLEVTELADTYQFVRPSECATVRATFKKAPSFSDVKSGEYYYDPVMWAVQKGITNGTSATTFSPTKACSRAEVVTFLWRANGSPAPSSTDNPFSDVPAGQWYTDAVLWAVERGITTGTGGGKFSPDKVCTRAEVVTFLKRAVAKNVSTSESENPFVDVADGQWYTEAVLWAVEKGITTGTGGSYFSPNMTCDRAQIVTFLYRAVKK